MTPLFPWPTWAGPQPGDEPIDTDWEETDGDDGTPDGYVEPEDD